MGARHIGGCGILLVLAILAAAAAQATPLQVNHEPSAGEAMPRPWAVAYRTEGHHGRMPVRREIPDIISVAGEIITDLDQATGAREVPTAVLAKVHRVLAHAVDMERDVGPGDTFRLAYRDSTGDDGAELLYVSLRLGERVISVFHHRTADGFEGYFDRDGHSTEGPILKTPVEGARVSSPFGMRRHPILGYTRMHKGLDFAAVTGTPVLAAGDGVVVRRERNGGYGRFVQIRHTGGLATAYAHLSRYADALAPGDEVRQGQVIGYVGATGLATGPHLHYEMLRDGLPVDPSGMELAPSRVLAGEALDHFRIERIRLMVVLKRARGGASWDSVATAE